MKYVDTSKNEPIAKGSVRLVYEHPDDKNLLIKVMKPVNYKTGNPLQRIFYRCKRVYKQIILKREIREFKKIKNSPLARNVPEYHGQIVTDKGIGIVTTAIRDEKQNLAPTLSKLIKKREKREELQVLLYQLFANLNNSNVIAGDLNAGNIVYHSGQLYIIDGFGDKTFIPLQRMSKKVNKKKNNKKLQKLLFKVT